MNFHDLCKSGTTENVESYLQLMAAGSPDDLGFLIDLRNDQRYTPLHCAIFARNLDAVQALVERGADVDLKCHGTPPIHLCVATAVQPRSEDFAFKCLSLLLERGANASSKDDHGFTAIHLAAEYNLPKFIEKLVAHSDEAAEAVSSAPKLTGVTALHRAAAADADLAITALLVHGASPSCKTAELGLTPLHLAGSLGKAKAWRALLAAQQGPGMQQALLSAVDHLNRTALELAARSGWAPNQKDPAVLTPADPQQSSAVTYIVTNPLCRQHHTCPPSQVETPGAPPENIKRLQVLVDEQQGVLCAADISARLNWVHTAQPAALADVLRVHEWAYVRRVQEHCASITSADPEDEEEGFTHLDGDTAVSSQTYNAALAAAGAVCEAVDLVAGPGDGRRARNAFCPVRPPGHHAGPNGLVKGDEPGAPDSHGFCILNNVSIGAAYAMNRHRDTVRKVAIVDFDVHHGNGTEETVRWLRPSTEVTHLSGGGGGVFGLMHTVTYKPWHSERDPSNVMFVSVHGYGPRERGLEHMLPMAAFYPGSGKTVIPDVSLSDSTAHCENTRSSSSAAGSMPLKNGAATPLGASGGSVPMDAVRADSDSEEGSADDSDEGFGEHEEEEDGGGDIEGSSDEDEDEEDLRRAAQAGASGGCSNSGDVYRKVLKAKAMYSTFATPASAVPAQSAPQREMPPLILDIGVPLPGRSAADAGGADRGKVLEELSYRIQWRRYFREEIFPRLLEFGPDMIFISAGFDAHKKDTINGGYIALVEEDFEWVTDKLVQLANRCCDGRVVSVLEGGYQLGGEYCSAFAQSAKAHVRSLSNGTGSRAAFSVDETQAETALEQQHLAALEELRQAQLLRKEQAREQAYLARMKQLADAEAEAAEAAGQVQAQAQAQEQTEQHAAEEARSPAGAEASEDASTGRKRRRQQVDYAALDREMRNEAAKE